MRFRASVLEPPSTCADDARAANEETVSRVTGKYTDRTRLIRYAAILRSAAPPPLSFSLSFATFSYAAAVYVLIIA